MPEQLELVDRWRCPLWGCRQRRRCDCSPAKREETTRRLAALEAGDGARAPVSRSPVSSGSGGGYVDEFPPGF